MNHKLYNPKLHQPKGCLYPQAVHTIHLNCIKVKNLQIIFFYVWEIIQWIIDATEDFNIRQRHLGKNWTIQACHDA